MRAWFRQERRYAAVVEAETLAWQHGARGVAMAQAAADDRRLDRDRRRFYRLVAAVARRRLAALGALGAAQA
jgi:hypothetical protein